MGNIRYRNVEVIPKTIKETVWTTKNIQEQGFKSISQVQEKCSTFFSSFSLKVQSRERSLGFGKVTVTINKTQRVREVNISPSRIHPGYERKE